MPGIRLLMRLRVTARNLPADGVRIGPILVQDDRGE